jgi:hypothetical protein
MGPRLPFRLKVPKKDVIEGATVTSTVPRIHGYLHVDGDLLVVEWGGTVQVTEVGGTGVRIENEPLPDERLEVPIADLHRAELQGGWFQPRLAVQARTVGALAPVPIEEFGVVNFWYERSERFTAIAVAQELSDAIAAAGVDDNV